MSAVSSTPTIAVEFKSQFLFEPSDNHAIIAKKISEALAFAMRELSNSYLKKLEDSKPVPSMTAVELQSKRALLRQGPWTPQHFYTRCKELDAEALFQHLRSGNHMIRGYMNPKQFELKGSDDLDAKTRERYFFRAKEGQDAYQLAMSASTSFSIIDCGVAIRIAQYQALAYCFGEKFKIFFSDKAFGRLNFSSRTLHNPITKLFTKPSFMPAASSDRPAQLGTYCYFNGHPNYGSKHHHGLSGGYNAICTSDKRPPCYTVFGQLADSSERDLKQALLDAHNMPSQRWYRKLPSDVMMKEEEEINHRLELQEQDPRLSSPKSIEEIPGYDESYEQIFDPEVLSKLASISIETLRGVSKLRIQFTARD